MKLLIFWLIGLTLWIPSSWSQEKILLENFERFKVGTFNTSGWYIRDDNNELDQIYSIKEENQNKYLHADSEGQFVQIFKRGGWSVKYNPYFSWKWRILQHPEGSNAETDKNDTAAAIYIVYKKSLFSVRTVKYVWTQEGTNEYIKQNREDYPQITIRVGNKHVGEWVHEVRNIKQDYKNLFGKDPGKAIAFGVVSDADSVDHKKAIADFDDFYALKSIPKGYKKPDMEPVTKSKKSKSKKDVQEKTKKAN